MGYQIVARQMTSRDPQRCCEAVRSAILATAWLLVLFVAVYHFTFVSCDTGPVNSLLVIFSPTVHFKNECLNIHTYILFVSIFSYKNTPLCITLHTQEECCWDLKNSASRKISRKFVSWNSAEKMWLAGFSAEFLLSQPKLNKNSAEESNPDG